MKVERALALTCYLLVAVAMLALAAAEGSPLLVVAAAVLPALAYRRVERDGRPLGRRTSQLLALAALLLAPLDATALSGDTMLAIAHLLVAVQVVKLFGPKQPRDYLQLFAISLVHVGAAAVMTIDLSFSVLFVAYTVLASWALVLFCVVRETRRGAPEELERVRVGRGAPLAGGLLAFGMLAMVAAIFLLFPRFSALVLRVPARGGSERVAGFSGDGISLSDISSIKDNAAVVMQVIVERWARGVLDRPRWRGLAFDRYQGGRWRRSWHGQRRLPPGEPALREVEGALGAPSWWLPAPGGWRGGGWKEAGRTETALYSVTLVPTGSDVLFVAPHARRLGFLSAARPGSLYRTPGDAVVALGLPHADVRYRVESVPPPIELALAAPVDAAGVIDGVDYLALPEDGPEPARLRAEAERIAAAAGARTPFARAVALERHLQGRYGYTLELEPPPPGRDPVEYFLFESRRGHCELFASAFVLMARALGLPARLVNGFQAGEWNDLGGFFLVRQRDAHAWAEVHFEGAGWIAFDPTPAVDSKPGGVFARLRHLLDYLRLRWLNHVIGYSLADQLSFADRLRRRGESAAGRVRGLGRELFGALRALPRRQVALGLAGGVAVLGLAAGLRALARRRRGGRAARAAAQGPPGVELYAELRQALARLGYEPRPGETARELAARAAPLGGDPRTVVEYYYAVRFGGRRPTPAAHERALGALARLRAQAAARGRDVRRRAGAGGG
ncbi:MAG: hypothetical protein KatS3mg102_0871 [Planctomycetota bacterium]|nr:MAG: hypothetical protein KatS3mg102_0871 [Planctomycetota bacterium]